MFVALTRVINGNCRLTPHEQLFGTHYQIFLSLSPISGSSLPSVINSKAWSVLWAKGLRLLADDFIVNLSLFKILHIFKSMECDVSKWTLAACRWLHSRSIPLRDPLYLLKSHYGWMIYSGYLLWIALKPTWLFCHIFYFSSKI